jgi:NADH-quinone oxidoreductase subunit N
MQTYLLLPNNCCDHFMASMTVGNIMALRQVNVKRMLASGISHAGFMLMTLLSVTNAAGSLLYYTRLMP